MGKFTKKAGIILRKLIKRDSVALFRIIYKQFKNFNNYSSVIFKKKSFSHLNIGLLENIQITFL